MRENSSIVLLPEHIDCPVKGKSALAAARWVVCKVTRPRKVEKNRVFSRQKRKHGKRHRRSL